MQGKIIQVNSKGYGFISSKEKMFTRIYFHWSALKPTTLNFAELKKGMIVEFEPSEYQDKKTGLNKGWRAFKIEVIDPIPEASLEVIK